MIVSFEKEFPITQMLKEVLKITLKKYLVAMSF